MRRPPVRPCGNVPAISFAGLISLTARITTTRPVTPFGPTARGQCVPTSPATAPYCFNVNLSGCRRACQARAKYRLMYRDAPTAGDPSTLPLPLADAKWDWPGVGPQVVADSGGFRPAARFCTRDGLDETLLYPFDATIRVRVCTP